MASRRRRSGKRRPEPPAKRRGGAKAVQRKLDQGVEQATYLERVKKGEAAKATKPWDDAFEALADLIEQRVRTLPELSMLSVAGRARITAEIMARAGDLLTAAETATRLAISEAMSSIAVVEAAWQVAVMEPTLPLGVSLRMPPIDQLRALNESARWRKFGGQTQRPLVEWTKGLERGARTGVRNVVTTGLRDGKAIPDITRELRKVADVAKHQAEAIARTGISHAANVAAQQFAEANTETVIGVLWRSTLDSRTSIICIGLDGKVFHVDDGPRPPAHFRCRSRVEALPRSAADILAGKTGRPTDDELEAARLEATEGTRSAIDYSTGRATQVSARESYGDYLRRQPATVQDRVLGSTRARLFRSRTLSVEQFTDDDYSAMTIRELEARWNLRIPSRGL